MVDLRLLVTTVGVFAGAGGYAYVAGVLRSVDAPPRLERRRLAFTVWWGALAASTGVTGLQNALALGGVRDLPLHLTLSQLFVLTQGLALAGLLAYLLYLLEVRRVVVPVGAFYVTYFTTFTLLTFILDPVGVFVDPGGVGFAAGAAVPTPLLSLVAVALFLPPLLAAAWYATMLPDVGDVTERYRVAMVSGSIAVWSLANVALGVGFQAGQPTIEMVAHLVALAAPFGAYLAYAPPRALQRRWGVVPITARRTS